MRQAALATYGIDIYPAGSLSAYRTWEQQSYLYNLYLAGLGAPANPPGTSSHEYGTAVDLASPEMRTVIDQLGPTYGWGRSTGPTSGGTSTTSAAERPTAPAGARAPAARDRSRAAARRRASSRSAASGTRPTTSPATGRAPCERRARGPARSPPPSGTETGSWMLVETWARSPRSMPTARTPPIPPPDSRSSAAIDSATPMSAVSSSTLKAASGGRAVTSVAPGGRVRLGRAEVRRAARPSASAPRSAASPPRRK